MRSPRLVGERSLYHRAPYARASSDGCGNAGSAARRMASVGLRIAAIAARAMASKSARHTSNRRPSGSASRSPAPLVPPDQTSNPPTTSIAQHERTVTDTAPQGGAPEAEPAETTAPVETGAADTPAETTTTEDPKPSRADRRIAALSARLAAQAQELDALRRSHSPRHSPRRCHRRPRNWNASSMRGPRPRPTSKPPRPALMPSTNRGARHTPTGPTAARP